MRRGIAWRDAAFGALVVVVGGSAIASDHSDRCDSTDGRYVVEEGSLYDAEAYRRGAAEAIPFEVRSDTVEAEEVGYCVSWAKEAAGRRFDFEYRRSVRRIAFEVDGVAREVEMGCVLEGDGLPAAFECDRKVVTRRTGMAAPIPAATDASDAGTWEHNGSTLALIADGDDRRFLYTVPRAGLVANGVEAGTLLFGGRIEGTSLVGRARIFTKRCGELSYPVRGAFENGGARLVLTGKVPRVDDGCRRTGSADDRLVFVRTR